MATNVAKGMTFLTGSIILRLYKIFIALNTAEYLLDNSPFLPLDLNYMLVLRNLHPGLLHRLELQ